MHTYAGIGSRDITKLEESKIHKIANILLEKGYVLYSGGAEGSDQAFEQACGGFGISYRPWIGFNDHIPTDVFKLVYHNEESMESIKQYHPMPSRLSPAAMKLMSRNYFQVNGIGELPQVDFVVCCANMKNNEIQGGTGQAVRIATARNIPVINIRSPFWESSINRIPCIECCHLADIQASLSRLST